MAVSGRRADWEDIQAVIASPQARCNRHKLYKGVIRPVQQCAGCWKVYFGNLLKEFGK
jgi:uncharacterized protein (DUF983 family)